MRFNKKIEKYINKNIIIYIKINGYPRKRNKKIYNFF